MITANTANFDNYLNRAKRMIPNIISNARNIEDWQALGVRSFACIGDKNFGLAWAAVQTVMIPGGTEHLTLARIVSEVLNKRDVKYLWVSRCIARLILDDAQTADVA